MELIVYCHTGSEYIADLLLSVGALVTMLLLSLDALSLNSVQTFISSVKYMHSVSRGTVTMVHVNRVNVNRVNVNRVNVNGVNVNRVNVNRVNVNRVNAELSSVKEWP